MKQIIGKVLVVFSVFLVSYSSTAAEIIAMGSVANSPHRTLMQCFRDASKTYDVPVDILIAIARTESDLNPYAVNLNGRSYRFTNRRSAVLFISRHAHRGESLDVGIMQINRMWFDKLHYPYETGLDACFNIMLGAYILKKMINIYGENWRGIAAYHSSTPEKNIRYAWRVYKNLKLLYTR